MADPIKSVLYDVQAAQGAEFEDFDGWLWTSNLGDVAAEYDAIRTGAGMWDVYPLVKWDFTGRDAIRAAQRVFSNDLLSLDAGQVRYGAFVDEGGLMVDDGTIYKLADDHCWVMTNDPGHAEFFAKAMSDLDVQVVDRTREMPLISVQGPRSRDILQTLTDADLSSLRYFRFLPDPIEVAGTRVWIMRTGFSGELGFEMIPAAREDAVALWTKLGEAGTRPFGTDAVEIARVEAGLVVFGVDYQVGTSPYDLSFDRMVALDAGAGFQGKDALRAAASDPPNRFKTLRVQGDEVPEYGAQVTKNGTPVGTLTSPAASPGFGVIGLAVLRTEHAGNGTEVDVALGEGTVAATVDDLSIFDPDKQRPRS